LLAAAEMLRLGPSGKCSCAAFRGQSRVGAWRAARSANSGLHGSALARQMFFVLSAYAVEWGQTFAGYRIVRLLGSGGMGEVYLTEHPRLPRHNALKVLPAASARKVWFIA